MLALLASACVEFDVVAGSAAFGVFDEGAGRVALTATISVGLVAEALSSTVGTFALLSAPRAFEDASPL
ncbi:MAG TPA: hypothetical protein VHC69_23505 [Polyangiaceae bacterium]|nr:hypothetical protein [Polyangiaceae bacterium]